MLNLPGGILAHAFEDSYACMKQGLYVYTGKEDIGIWTYMSKGNCATTKETIKLLGRDDMPII